MQPALSTSSRADATASASSTLPVLQWDGRSPTALIGQVEARLAAGARFVVLARSAPFGRSGDRGFLAGWWRTARPRLAGLCAGWAIVDAAGDSALPATFIEFPIRHCADRAEALAWLRARLAGRALDDLLSPPVMRGILNLS